MKRHTRLGFSLIEILVAISVTSLALISVSAAVTYSIRNARFSKQKTQALGYAQDAIETMRQQRDLLGWDLFKQVVIDSGDSAEFCLNELPATTEAFASLKTQGKNDVCSSIADSVFTRTMTFNLDASNPDSMTLISNVVWTEGDQVYETPINTKFYRW